jgi:hypothetical protein
MSKILNLLAPLLLGSINRENLCKRVRKKEATSTVAGKKKNNNKINKQKTVPKGWCSELGLLLRQS